MYSAKDNGFTYRLRKCFHFYLESIILSTKNQPNLKKNRFRQRLGPPPSVFLNSIKVEQTILFE